MIFFFLIYSFADNEPLVKAITVPEVVLEFVSEFSSKDESYKQHNYGKIISIIA